ncbi:RagB/SusD family nutrient uptake outer membrane protein [Pedobacter paludis]|uniref:RagB/SusD family nutrient uptake outer membrane protein n=1 Tax=Pedobacter paludis TaxID=2203212 RepID=A0A317EZ33_9SPHI|nr:RagB/SusD family nutrient uptake outer membrane protein [Pedobacter paludis]PWS30508.1 hypothetical protein DF947_16345 [Pedobacter paludis]
MKKILIMIILASFIFSGCKKFLDVKSKTNVVESDMFSNEQGFKDATAGVYYKMTSTQLYGDKLTMSFMDVIARRYDIHGYPLYNSEYSHIYDNPGDYKDDHIKGIISDVWENMYNAIANTNNVLANIDAKRDVFLANNYNLIKGEALGLRAYMHFDLVRMFGQPYLTGADKPSIPYVSNFSAKVVNPLLTVKQITDSVIKDLNAAAILLKGDDLKSSSSDNAWLNNRKCHFNYLAVEATLARVYLYRGDKANALLHAKNVIAYSKLRFVTEPELNLGSTVDYTFTPEQIFSLNKVDFGTTTQISFYFNGATSGSALSNSIDKSGQSEQAVERIYETTTGGSTDYRYNYLWRLYTNDVFPAKFWQDGAKEKALVPLIRLPEMYYIAAEASTTAEGVAYLNTVRKNRGLKPLALDLNAEDLKNEIFKEYQKEFYCEGQLFYYYKRLNLNEMVDNDNINKISTAGVYVFPLPDLEILNGNR